QRRQQDRPSGAVVLLILRVPLDHRNVELEIRPRHRDIEKTPHGGALIGADALFRILVRLEIEDEALGIVAVDAVGSSLGNFGEAAPEEDDRKFEPLAGVNGHELDLGPPRVRRWSVSFAGVALFAAILEPFEQAEQVEILAMSRLFKLSE